MKTLILILVVSGLSGTTVLAQVGLIPGTTDPSKADLRVLTQNGCLVSSSVDVKKGQATFYVVGEDQGYVDINDFKLFLAQLGHGKESGLKMENSSSDKYVESTSSRKTPAKAKEFNLQARFSDEAE